jgi:hypothetical protein
LRLKNAAVRQSLAAAHPISRAHYQKNISRRFVAFSAICVPRTEVRSLKEPGRCSSAHGGDIQKSFVTEV